MSVQNPMFIRYTCTTCGRILKIVKEDAGRNIRCPTCKSVCAAPYHDEFSSEPVLVKLPPEPPVRARRSILIGGALALVGVPALVAATVYFMWPDTSSLSKPIPHTLPPPSGTMAQDLWVAYQLNPEVIEQMLKDKGHRYIDVTGVVWEVNTSVDGRPEVRLWDGTEFGFFGVRCVFHPGFANDVAALQKGQEITVYGQLRGKDVYLDLDDCSLVFVDGVRRGK